ncbi:MAG: sugar isomerase domain-containing protein [Caldilineaceae bacterium]
MNPAVAYLDAARSIIERIQATQLDALDAAAAICADSILKDGLVHLFGTGHSRMFIEEMYPRHGSFPGFHPMVELSLTYHTNVVGTNGQRQAMFLEHVEGLGAVIMRNFVFGADDSFIVFSNSGVNEVVVEVALEAKAQPAGHRRGVAGPLPGLHAQTLQRQTSARHLRRDHRHLHAQGRRAGGHRRPG